MEPFSSTLWLFRDGKPGHENQVLGLAEAFVRRKPFRVESVFLPHNETFRARRRTISLAMEKLPRPDLVIGAGHTVHVFQIYAARWHRVPSVVLMKPSLPEFLFDYCVIPDHDLGVGAVSGGRRIVTRGAVNRVRHDPALKEKRGLLLIGGPSREHGWDGERLLADLNDVVKRGGGLKWVLTDSRRTPDGFVDAVRRELPAVECSRAENTGPDWLPEQLARAEVAWVTRDSVSMIYEALTAGARVGLFEAPLRAKRSKLTDGVEKLVRQGFVTTWRRWRDTGELAAPPEVPAEADRCAGELLRRLGWE